MLSVLFAALAIGGAQDTVTITLDEAVARALVVSPRVAAARGWISAPRGERAEEILPFASNPVVEFGAARRRTVGATTTDREFRVSQELEIAGQNFVRASAAGKRVRAAERGVEDAERLTALEARLAYVELAVAERRAALLDSAAAFGERLAEIARRQMAAGDVALLEFNAALLEAARQRSAAERALADLGAASAELARVLDLPPDSVPRTAGVPELLRLELPGDSALLARATGERPDLEAARLQLRGAEGDVTAARLGLVPNLELSGFTGEEEGDDDLLGFSVGLRVPLFRRQQSSTGLAKAERAAANAELEATRRRVRSEVLAAAALYRRALGAEGRFQEDVLRAAGQNASLAERAFVEGKVGLAEVVLFRTAAVSARLEYLEVLQDAYRGWYELAAALGTEPETVARPGR